VGENKKRSKKKKKKKKHKELKKAEQIPTPPAAQGSSAQPSDPTKTSWSIVVRRGQKRAERGNTKKE